MYEGKAFLPGKEKCVKVKYEILRKRDVRMKLQYVLLCKKEYMKIRTGYTGVCTRCKMKLFLVSCDKLLAFRGHKAICLKPAFTVLLVT